MTAINNALVVDCFLWTPAIKSKLTTYSPGTPLVSKRPCENRVEIGKYTSLTHMLRSLFSRD